MGPIPTTNGQPVNAQNGGDNGLSPFGALAVVSTRDLGHALNAGQNLVQYGSLHAPAGAPAPFGTSLVSQANAVPGAPAPIINFAGIGSPAPASGSAPKDTTPTGNAPTNGAPTTPNYTGNYYGAGYGQGSQDYSAFKGLYDAEIGNMQNQADALPAYQQAAAGNVQLQYDPQYNALMRQNAEGNTNLDIAQRMLDTQRSQGIRNLGNSLRAALNGYQNQIGVMGAGNSSAAPLIGYALSQQGNRQMADMNTNFDQQQTGLNAQRTNLGYNYQDQLDGLNAWKQSQLNQIAQQYSQQQSQLQQQIMGANANEAQYLAMYGQTALANQAIQNMQALEAQYKDQVGQLNNHFQQVNAPVADISQYAGPYSIQQITPGQLSPLSFASNQDTSTAPTAMASLTRRPDQTTAQSNLGF